MMKGELKQKPKLKENEIELKVAGGFYLVSEGRYVNWNNLFDYFIKQNNII